MQVAESSSHGAGRVLGLDTLRFVAALWVAVSHVGFVPLFAQMDRSTPIGFVLQAASGILFSGAAAVVIFFVVSGFCIHYPFARGAQFEVTPYFIRRYLRITIPMFAAMLLTEAADVDSIQFFHAVLWSLVAELMYYTLYPVIRRLMTRFPLDALIVVSYLLAVSIWVAGPRVSGFAIYGWEWNWLLCLPCWLLGVRLAETWSNPSRLPGTAKGRAYIWKWRLFIWALSSTCLALNFHSFASYALTLNFFGLFVYFWLRRELEAFNSLASPPALLEKAGAWSYSIYLCHIAATAIYAKLNVPSLAWESIGWGLKMALVLLISYAFYLAVERPSHLLARRAASRRTQLGY